MKTSSPDWPLSQLEEGDKEDKREERRSGHFEEVEGERGTGTQQEREKGVCEGTELRVEEGCWYGRWAGPAEEHGAGWVGRRVSGLG